MARRARWTLIALTVLLLAVVVFVPASRAQVARISNAVLLLPKTALSLPSKAAGGSAPIPSARPAGKEPPGSSVIVGASYHNDTSPPLRDIKPMPMASRGETEANENPRLPVHHKDSPDSAVQRQHVSAPNMPG